MGILGVALLGVGDPTSHGFDGQFLSLLLIVYDVQADGFGDLMPDGEKGRKGLMGSWKIMRSSSPDLRYSGPWGSNFEDPHLSVDVEPDLSCGEAFLLVDPQDGFPC